MGPDVPDVNMTVLTVEEFNSRYDALLKKFTALSSKVVNEYRYGIPCDEDVRAMSTKLYLYVFALNNETNKSYLTELQILRMLSEG